MTRFNNAHYKILLLFIIIISGYIQLIKANPKLLLFYFVGSELSCYDSVVNPTNISLAFADVRMDWYETKAFGYAEYFIKNRDDFDIQGNLTFDMGPNYSKFIIEKIQQNNTIIPTCSQKYTYYFSFPAKSFSNISVHWQIDTIHSQSNRKTRYIDSVQKDNTICYRINGGLCWGGQSIQWEHVRLYIHHEIDITNVEMVLYQYNGTHGKINGELKSQDDFFWSQTALTNDDLYGWGIKPQLSYEESIPYFDFFEQNVSDIIQINLFTQNHDDQLNTTQIVPDLIIISTFLSIVLFFVFMKLLPIYELIRGFILIFGFYEVANNDYWGPYPIEHKILFELIFIGLLFRLIYLIARRKSLHKYEKSQQLKKAHLLYITLFIGLCFIGGLSSLIIYFYLNSYSIQNNPSAFFNAGSGNSLLYGSVLWVPLLPTWIYLIYQRLFRVSSLKNT